MTTIDDVLARARSALGHGTLYWLGAGGTDPRSDVPTTKVNVAAEWAASTPEKRAELAPLAAAMGIDVHNPALWLDACDCSGYVCWALGFSRNGPNGPIWTNSIFADAKGAQARFRHVTVATPGALVVYPSGDGETYGHVAIVAEADAAGNATQILHCSKANVEGVPHDGIKASAPDAFTANRHSIYVWCRDVEER